MKKSYQDRIRHAINAHQDHTQMKQSAFKIVWKKKFLLSRYFTESTNQVQTRPFVPEEQDEEEQMGIVCKNTFF